MDPFLEQELEEFMNENPRKKQKIEDIWQDESPEEIGRYHWYRILYWKIGRNLENQTLSPCSAYVFITRV
jgi:hypothetical protein